MFKIDVNLLEADFKQYYSIGAGFSPLYFYGIYWL